MHSHDNGPRERSALLAIIPLAMLVATGATQAAESPSTAAAGASPVAALCGKGPLDILLTNDDGYQSPGIRALLSRLRAAGHHVVLAAPDWNASGTSMSLTQGTIAVRRDASEPDVVGVAGSPATSMLLGLTVLYPAGRRPDLVISGINDGANAGPLLALSGTIGAALAGTTLADPPIPGYAVNADRPATPAARAALPADHLDQLALHLVQLVERTRGWFCEHGRVTRTQVVLNVNYPARPLADARGVRLARQGRVNDMTVRFEPAGDGAYSQKRIVAGDARDAKDADTTLLAEGWVTVTPISARLQADDSGRRELERRLRP